MDKIYQKKHELWLAITFASFAINDEDIKSRLYDFSLIAFRHMKWLGSDVLESGNDYNYDRDMTLLKRDNVFEIIEALKEETQAMQSAYPQTILGERARTDDDYLIEYLSQILKDESNNEVITAFNMKRTWLDKNLAQDQIDALTLFLFEESYKEYELILVYAYMQARTQNPLHFNVFQDLIDESHFHLKSFLLFLFGLQIEIVQSFIDGRFFSLLDVVADSIGIVIGVVFVWLFKKAIR